MTSPTIDPAVPLARYAERLHSTIGGGHHVASPLGAWLLLASAAPAATGPARRELEDVLGTDAESAAATAAALLADPHPLVEAAAAVWSHPSVRTESLMAWVRGLPTETETGDLPTPTEADRWADEHTRGLIQRFPIHITPDVVLLLASALATKVSWTVPFEVVPADRLGSSSPWSRGLNRVLRSPSLGHQTFIARSDRAGDVGVHTADARQGPPGYETLSVTSVIADPAVGVGDVLAAAHEIAMRAASGIAVERRSLFDLPLGEGQAWTVTEDDAEVTPADAERCVATLPSWSAESQHDLMVAALGFPAAAEALVALLPPPGPYRSEARQSAVARFGRVGFEAAAVTAFGLSRSLMLARAGRRRTAEIRFGRPYAVVAVAGQMRSNAQTHAMDPGPWHGVPVFSAWIAEPDDTEPPH